MPISPEEKIRLQLLAEELVDCIPPTPVHIVGVTGEMFTEGALRMARLYDKATNGQRTALDEIAKAFENCPPKGRR